MSEVAAAAKAASRDTGSIVVSIAVLVIVIGWLVVVFSHIGDAPVMSPDGKTVAYDPYSRAKDILVLILPLMTTAVGFWLGSQGTTKAQAAAAEAQAEVKKTKDQNLALVAVGNASQPGEDIVELAKQKHPGLFREV